MLRADLKEELDAPHPHHERVEELLEGIPSIPSDCSSEVRPHSHLSPLLSSL